MRKKSGAEQRQTLDRDVAQDQHQRHDRADERGVDQRGGEPVLRPPPALDRERPGRQDDDEQHGAGEERGVPTGPAEQELQADGDRPAGHGRTVGRPLRQPGADQVGRSEPRRGAGLAWSRSRTMRRLMP